MKLLIFGATGGTGRELLKQALDQGHHVVAFARDPVKLDDFQNANVQVVRGDVLDSAAVEDAVADRTRYFPPLVRVLSVQHCVRTAHATSSRPWKKLASDA
jgi:uncharacterized protein YbjT (DUF2867 family)